MLLVNLTVRCSNDVSVTELQRAICLIPHVKEVTYERGEWLPSRKEAGRED